MKTETPKAVTITTPWLHLSTGYAISWEKSLPFRVVMELIKVADDQDIILNTIKIL